MGTNRLYYRDSYLTDFTARVVRKSPDKQDIFLDQTAFYPTSGGQPHDGGTINGIQVVDIVDGELGIMHRLAAPLEDDVLRGSIDWPRRFDHMQQHTGQHLLSAVFEHDFGCRTLSFHLGAEVSTIELACDDLSESQIESAEARCSELVRNALPVRITFEDADQVQGLRKESARSGVLRIVEIEGFDRSACGGTHVRSTAEIGTVQIRRIEKIRGNVRLEFVCGVRALRRSRKDYQILTSLSRLASVALDELSDYVDRQRSRLSEIEKEKLRLTIELARSEGERSYRETAPDPSDGMRRLRMDVAKIDEAVRARAQAFASHPRSVAFVVSTEPPACLVACSPDSNLNAGAVLKQALVGYGGRGGGSSTLAQGSLPQLSAATELGTLLGLEKHPN